MNAPRSPKPSETQPSQGSLKPRPAEELEATVVTRDSVPSDATQVERSSASDFGAATRPDLPMSVTGPDPSQIAQLGDFRLIKKLGQGGMGEVYLAHQVSLDRQVALKIMSRQFASKENFVLRFKREAQTMAKLDHPNIVRGFAVGEDQGLLYLAMELIDGKSMQNWMDDLGKLSVADALHVTLLVADALQHAHSLKLIHRDIKPDNILVTKTGMVKLSDMGLAKATDEDMSMTQSGTGMGTPYYMPPEQARNAKHVDHRSDIYALGCTLYHFLTGKLPFAGNSTSELILSKEKGTFTRARRVTSEVPERLDLMIDKMLAKDPKYRYQSCEELARDLRSLQLHGGRLSFIDGTAAPGATAVRSAGVPQKGPPVNSQTPHAGDAQTSKMWYVASTGPDGRLKKAKMSTGQIKQQLKLGNLERTAKVSTSPSGNYLPIAGVPEFEEILKVQQIKADVAKKSAKYQKLYEDIDRQQRWYKWSKWFKGKLADVTGVVSLILYLAVVMGVAYGAYLLWPKILVMIRG